MRKSYVNLAELRSRVKATVALIAREEGLGEVNVYVEIGEATLRHRVIRVQIEEAPDGINRHGKKWEDN